MKRSGTTILMDFDCDHLGAIGVQGHGSNARVSGWDLIRRPSGVDGGDAATLGSWLRERLEQAGLGTGRVVIAAPRSEVVLKLLSVPGGQALDEHELANVVRLQMQRQTAVSIEDAVFDYSPFDVAPGATDRQVLVGAIPGARLAWRRQVVENAGLKLGGLRLRASGIAELVGAAAEAGDAPALGIGIGPTSAEFALVEHGRLVFARTADLPEPDDDVERLARRIAVEAKRTAMSFRVAQRTPDVGTIVVLGDDELARQTARLCAADLEVPGTTLLPPIGGLSDLAPEVARAMAPLVGLAIQDERERVGLDFVNPRREPDRMSGVRRAVLLGMLAAIVAFGASFVARSSVLGSLEDDLDNARARAATLRKEYLDAMATDARAEHLSAWIEAGPEWSAYLGEVVGMLPSPGEGPLDAIALASEPGVTFTKGSSTPYPGAWSTTENGRIGLDGRASSREVSTALRERVLADGRYALTVRGADVADRFSIELRREGGRDE